MHVSTSYMSFFFFNDTATTEIYTLSLHDALPIWPSTSAEERAITVWPCPPPTPGAAFFSSTSEKSSPSGSCGWASSRSEEHTSELQHANISYAVFCLKKKKKQQYRT